MLDHQKAGGKKERVERKATKEETVEEDLRRVVVADSWENIHETRKYGETL